MDWPATLLAAAGTAPASDYPSDGFDLAPILAGERVVQPRTLYWRYKAHQQRAMRQGAYKYLSIRGQDFLFDLAVDVRERANLAQQEAERLVAMKRAYADWEAQMLPIPTDAYSHRILPERQADHYGAAKAD